MSFLIILLFICLLLLNSTFQRSLTRCRQITGGKPKQSFLKENYPNAYTDSWKVALMFLNIRYHFNDYNLRMKQIRKHLYNDVLGEKSLYGHKYESTKDIMNDNNTNRLFEEFFYQKCGQSKQLKYFPFESFKASVFSDTVYDSGDNILKGWDKDKIEQLKKKREVSKIRSENKSEYDKTVNKCLKAMNNIVKSKIKPTLDKKGKYTINTKGDFLFNKLTVEWIPSFPPKFRERYHPNYNLCDKKDNIDNVLSIITMNHMPVFTNNRFSDVFKIERSPGLMTSSIPDANRKIRQLEWVKDEERKPVIFYNTGDGKGPPNFMVETYASPLNHNAEVFCSLFPSDKYISGCIGKFDDDISKRFKEYNWIPKVLFVNPPYTYDAITNGNRITDNLHSKYPLITVTTLSRRDGGVLGPMLPAYGDTPFEIYKADESSSLMNPMLDCEYLKDFIIVPEELFEYEDLFTGKKMFTASRAGAVPTDTIILIKSSMDNNSRLEDIQKIIYDEIPKTMTDKYKIEDDKRDDIIKEVMSRSKSINVHMTPKLANMIIDNLNRAV